MDTLRSWIIVLWMAGSITWVLVQAYRLEKWKENNS